MKGSLFSSKYSSPLKSPLDQPSFLETMMEENVDLAEPVIRKWDINDSELEKFSTLFVDDRTEAKRLLEATIALQNAMHYCVKHRLSSEKLTRAHELMQIAMKRMEMEFYTILSANRKNLDSERASEMAMADLKSIADCMVACGYGQECVQIYKIIRKSVIDETLYYLGVERLNNSQIKKMEWTILETKIKKWLHAVKAAIKTLFSREKILCDFIFSSSEKIAESCFNEITRDAALNLFTFPENFGKCKKIQSPEKIFRALDLYEAISDLWPEIESIFSNMSLTAVRLQAVAAILKLGEAVRTMLGQFEGAIQKDSSKSPAGGGVHPLTRYVMNFLVFLGDYSGAVADIVEDWPVKWRTPPPEYHFSGGEEAEPAMGEIRARFAWLILLLLCKLDGKAALYNDVALSYLFLANNLNYVVSKIRNSHLGLLMGSDWILKHEAKVKQYLANYERIGWTKVISSLPENPTAEIPPHEVRELFKKFYLSFQVEYNKQKSWVIPDPKIREKVKISVAKKIVPGYRVIYQKHWRKCTREVGVDLIVRYVPEDLNNYLSDLFFTASDNTSSHDPSTTSYWSSHGR